jgi:hypothetical protein
MQPKNRTDRISRRGSLLDCPVGVELNAGRNQLLIGANEALCVKTGVTPFLYRKCEKGSVKGNYLVDKSSLMRELARNPNGGLWPANKCSYQNIFLFSKPEYNL